MNFKLPTPEEIHSAFQQGEASVMALFHEVNSVVGELAQQLEQQAEVIKGLQAKLGKNSTNSNKPPSSDGYGKKSTPKRTASQRKKGQKPNGGQTGHKGHTLEASEHPDETQIHPTDPFCQVCGYSLADEAVSHYEERQVFDIPALKIEITAHKAEVKICPQCGTQNKGSFPEGVTQPTQYGNGVKTWASYFSVEHFIPLARTAQIFEDLLGHRISQARVLLSCQELATHVAPTTQAIKAHLQQADVVHFDESGLRVEGKLHWLHSASTDTVTYYLVHAKRGQLAIDEAGILPNFTGAACHDHWTPYFAYEACSHALCNAHHLRELSYLEKHYQQPFAPKMATLLIEINEAKQDHLGDGFKRDEITVYETRYNEILQEGFDANPKQEAPPDSPKKRGRIKQTPAYNLLRRFRDFKAEVLAFMYDFRVPFTNNQAEQDIRMIKVKQKVSGCFRTFSGAEEFVENRSYISTVRKNNQNVFQALQAAFENRPFIPQL